MAFVQGITIAVLVAFVAFPAVHSQADSFITPTERALRANLTHMVQYVVHPSATPSMDLINFALVSGGFPKTQEERNSYLRLLKEIAKNTPELVKQFTTSTTLPGGFKSETVDEMGIDAQVTSRAIQYVESGAYMADTSNTTPKATTTPPITSTVTRFRETPLVPAVSANTQLDLAQQVSSSNQVGVQDLHQNKLIPASDGTVSLEEVFRFINNYSAQNQAGPQLLI